VKHVAVAAALAAGGCAAVHPALPVRTFVLAYPPPEAAGIPPLPVTVRVVPFGIVAAYDRQGFTYREGAYDVGVDYYNRWVGSPAGLITDLVARDLAASGRVQAVLQAPSALANDYEINGQIETLEEQDDAGACIAHLRLRIFVVRARSADRRQVLLQDGFAADEPCRRGDPGSYAEAMSRAVQRVSDQIRVAALDAIAHETGSG
jgi:ABC-type uncharacterized transport system auxiliary subunit